MSYSLFLSHSRRDKKRIGALETSLAHTHDKLYTDYWEDQDPLPHSERLRDKIRDSDAFLVYWGPSVEQSDVTKIWVGWELGVATEQIYKRFPIPIFVLEDTEGKVSLPIPELTDYAVIDPTDDEYLRQLPNVIDWCIQIQRSDNIYSRARATNRQREKILSGSQSFTCVNCNQEYRIWFDANQQEIICPSCNKPGNKAGADRVV